MDFTVPTFILRAENYVRNYNDHNHTLYIQFIQELNKF